MNIGRSNQTSFCGFLATKTTKCVSPGRSDWDDSVVMGLFTHQDGCFRDAGTSRYNGFAS
jgi:hypothetical protein